MDENSGRELQAQKQEQERKDLELKLEIMNERQKRSYLRKIERGEEEAANQILELAQQRQLRKEMEDEVFFDDLDDDFSSDEDEAEELIQE